MYGLQGAFGTDLLGVPYSGASGGILYRSTRVALSIVFRVALGMGLLVVSYVWA